MDPRSHAEHVPPIGIIQVLGPKMRSDGLIAHIHRKTKLFLGGNNDVITELFLHRGSLVSGIPAGDGKLVNLFLRCTRRNVFVS
jgi:hypothetical protein